ncbi:hypothetical protein BT69DRAFT_162409 [Atractiella rhizophila]|nr:hypothetical protein BT69DRAFT_162409 [Atractiella rhizophila]
MKRQMETENGRESESYEGKQPSNFATRLFKILLNLPRPVSRLASRLLRQTPAQKYNYDGLIRHWSSHGSAYQTCFTHLCEVKPGEPFNELDLSFAKGNMTPGDYSRERGLNTPIPAWAQPKQVVSKMTHKGDQAVDPERLKYLISRWTASSAQSFTEVDCPKLRDLLTYIHGTPRSIPSSWTIQRTALECAAHLTANLSFFFKVCAFCF